MQELHGGGEARPNLSAPDLAGPNAVASSHSVVADLTDEHHLDTSDLESLLADQQAGVDQEYVVPAPPNGVAQPVEREPLIGPTGRPWPELPTPPPTDRAWTRPHHRDV